MRVSGGEKDFSDWASLPVVALNGGFVQTIVDEARDRRLMVVYGPDGRVLSTLVVNAALALMAASHRQARIYGARRTDILEIVEYSYRWRSGDGRLPRSADDAPILQTGDSPSARGHRRIGMAPRRARGRVHG